MATTTTDDMRDMRKTERRKPMADALDEIAGHLDAYADRLDKVNARELASEFRLDALNLRNMGRDDRRHGGDRRG